MRKYKCHKIVRAAAITDVGSDCFGVVHEITAGNELFSVGQGGLPKDFSARGVPSKGDYLVRYDNDYISWSPADVFEDGYTLMDDEKG